MYEAKKTVVTTILYLLASVVAAYGLIALVAGDWWLASGSIIFAAVALAFARGWITRLR
jgi:hypothetical protein